MINILIVEDDKTLNNGIALALKNENYNFVKCDNLQEARKVLKEIKIQLILLDLNLPDGNGYELLTEIRRTSAMPIIILTANDLEMNEVMGLELGADDYITKPFSLMVLRARISKVLMKSTTPGKFIYKVADMEFNFEDMKFVKRNQELVLSKTEQRLLRMLIDNNGIILARDTLIDKIWSEGAEYVDENALSVTIKRLRDKIEDIPNKPSYIQTVYGVGYVWKNS